MTAIRTRLEALEQRTLTAPDVVVIVGSPTAEQQALLDSGKVRVLVRLPDNGRGDDGGDQNKG